MTVALVYRMDPRRVLDLADADPSLYATMVDLAEELGE